MAVGTVASLRRGWVRRVGWYPGDWVWLALAALVVACGRRRRGDRPGPQARRGAPGDRRRPASCQRLARRRPRPAATAGTLWPRGLDGWTVVLVSSPATRGQTKPLAPRDAAPRDAGLPQVGVLDSSAFASLHPGYYVVFSGVYGAPGDAQTALETVRARGFGGAYVLRVAP